MRFLQAFLLFIARSSIASIFIAAAISKFVFFDQTVQYMTSKGFTIVPLFLVGAAAVEFFGGLSVVFGYKARFGATLLLLFLIPTTLIFHDFWNVTDHDLQVLQFTNFMKNVSIFGGLLYLICFGAGKFAFDNICFRTSPAQVSRPLDRPIEIQRPPEQKL